MLQHGDTEAGGNGGQSDLTQQIECLALRWYENLPAVTRIINFTVKVSDLGDRDNTVNMNGTKMLLKNSSMDTEENDVQFVS